MAISNGLHSALCKGYGYVCDAYNHFKINSFTALYTRRKAECFLKVLAQKFLSNFVRGF
jgi:hypothetical protein